MATPKDVILDTTLFHKGKTKYGLSLQGWLGQSFDANTIDTSGITDPIYEIIDAGVDEITDHYTDIESETYYYYGYNRDGEWEMKRNLIEDINIETTADEVLNPSITNLADAITNRVTLTYA